MIAAYAAPKGNNLPFFPLVRLICVENCGTMIPIRKLCSSKILRIQYKYL